MATGRLDRTTTAKAEARLAMAFAELSRQILRHANRRTSAIDFIQDLSKALLAFSGSDAVELRMRDGALHYCCETTGPLDGDFRFVTMPASQGEDDARAPVTPEPGRPHKKFASLTTVPFAIDAEAGGLVAAELSTGGGKYPVCLRLIRVHDVLNPADFRRLTCESGKIVTADVFHGELAAASHSRELTVNVGLPGGRRTRCRCAAF